MSKNLKEAILKFDLSRAKTGREAVLGRITSKQADDNLERDLKTLIAVIHQYAYEYAESVIGLDYKKNTGGFARSEGCEFVRPSKDGREMIGELGAEIINREHKKQHKRNQELSPHSEAQRKCLYSWGSQYDPANFDGLNECQLVSGHDGVHIDGDSIFDDGDTSHRATKDGEAV